MKKKSLLAAASVVAIMFGTSAVAQDVAFSLTNNSDATMVELRVGESSNDSWDEDILDGEEIGPGETANVSVEDELDDCEYDLQAVYDDGDTEEVFNIDLCELNDLGIDDGDVDEEEDEDEYDDEEEDEYDDEEEDEDEYDDEEEDEDEYDDEEEDEYDDEEEDEYEDEEEEEYEDEEEEEYEEEEEE
jgi:hypothetical protein